MLLFGTASVFRITVDVKGWQRFPLAAIVADHVHLPIPPSTFAIGDLIAIPLSRAKTAEPEGCNHPGDTLSATTQAELDDAPRDRLDHTASRRPIYENFARIALPPWRSGVYERARCHPASDGKATVPRFVQIA